jgi:DUF4097 and DUF4098 domain-containing protein YvlB
MKPATLRTTLLSLALAITAASPALAGARRTIDEHRPADAAGQVEINNVAGRIEVVGWGQAEVAVTGTIGSDVEKVEVTSAGTRTTVHVEEKQTMGMHFGSGSSSEANLVVHVPQGSSVTTTLVSADLSVRGVSGNQQIQTVSGDVDAAVAHEARVRTVSGDVKLAAGPDSKMLEVGTVSGDITVDGGGGEVTVSTVSGEGHITLGATTRVGIKSVSGDLTVAAGLAADGRLEAESVSGDIVIQFTGSVPPADFDLQSFSGDLSTCFGQKASREGHGPGSRLNFREGAGTAKVRVDTKSGDVTVCSRTH